MASIIGCLALAPPAPPRAFQDRDGERARLEAELRRYHGFINAYREGSDIAVDEILAWDPDRLPKVVAAAQSPLDPFRPWDPARVQTAAMLHTDAAVRQLDRGAGSVSFQLELAARVLLTGGAELHPFARRWYVAVSRVLRDRARLLEAEGLLERGRHNVPGDAVVLFESGVLQEQIATFAAFITITATELPSPRMPGRGLQTTGVASSEGANRSIAEQRRALDDAARWLEQSVRGDASSEPARLHLGRVQVLRGRDAEAARLLGPLAASAADAGVSYLATMFVGAMHHRRGRHAEAERMYRAAIEAMPSAQSAYIALSEVVQALGRGDESRAVLLRLLESPPASRDDPWWWYLVEPIGVARRRADELRAEARR